MDVNKPRFILGILLAILSYGDSKGQMRYFRPSTLPLQVDSIRAYVLASKDSIAIDTLFQMHSKGFPVAYFRKIRTSVCFDNTCRLLRVTLYWNPTGRYLGFALDKDEFFSKSKHKPFKKSEYKRMSDILADPFSPLATLAYSELAPTIKPATKNQDVDGVTSATAKNVLDHVVEGAAYTTYKMWHVVYGQTQDDVVQLTLKSLSDEFLLAILNSGDGSDKRWALGHIRSTTALTPTLEASLFAFISGTNYNLAERAIHALEPRGPAGGWQVLLADKLATADYAIKKLIITKFKEVEHLLPQAKNRIAQNLTSLNVELISNCLDILRQHHINDTATCQWIAKLLNSPNQVIARKAFAYLEELPVTDEVIDEQLKAYKAKLINSFAMFWFLYP